MEQIKIGWIDYSSDHRNKVMAVLHALSAPGAIDELGIGQVRDGFATRLFPGTSTIQTRAKYFFIVPYLLMELEKEHFSDYKAFLKELDKRELKLIEPLKACGEAGVIGENAGQDLKRKPSSIYWNGLRLLGMFKFIDYSLKDYASAVCAVNQEKNSHRALGQRRDNDIARDDSDAYQNLLSGGFWRCIPPEMDWKENIDIRMSFEEASFFKDRMGRSEHTRNSLFAYLVKSDPQTVREISDVEALGEEFELPQNILNVYDMAMRFSDFIYGATLRYNVILSNEENENAVNGWNEWLESDFVVNHLSDYNPAEAMFFLGIRNPRLSRFLKEWHEICLSDDIKAIDELIIQREIEIKSRTRAKLRNPSVYVYQKNHGMRGGKLDYRYGNARLILADIFDGLEKTNA